MNFGIYSYKSKDLNPDISLFQRKVFTHFNLNINQIEGISFSEVDKYREHGQYMMDIINTLDHEYFIFFDVDCIPLNILFLKQILSDIIDNNTLSGAIGCANHINKNDIYVHPCFFGFSKKLYEDCGRSDLKFFNYGDTGQKFTHDCRLYNKRCVFWDITRSDDDIWEISPLNKKFGHGTIFDNKIYHQFEIRDTSQQMNFINKCNNVINGYSL